MFSCPPAALDQWLCRCQCSPDPLQVHRANRNRRQGAGRVVQSSLQCQKASPGQSRCSQGVWGGHLHNQFKALQHFTGLLMLLALYAQPELHNFVFLLAFGKGPQASFSCRQEHSYLRMSIQTVISLVCYHLWERCGERMVSCLGSWRLPGPWPQLPGIYVLALGPTLLAKCRSGGEGCVW